MIKKADWLLLSGLLALTVVPMIGGAVRLSQLGGGAVTLENARFFAEPWPAVLHIVGASLYSVFGALQLTPGFRRCRPAWHRSAGRMLVPLGFTGSLSGLWMTLVYPAVPHDGTSVFVLRLVAGSAMTVFLGLGTWEIRKRNFSAHGAWMIRAYALGLGAGTQVVTHLPWFLFPEIQGEPARALFMGLGWGINIVVAEWALRRRGFSLARHAAPVLGG